MIFTFGHADRSFGTIRDSSCTAMPDDIRRKSPSDKKPKTDDASHFRQRLVSALSLPVTIH